MTQKVIETTVAVRATPRSMRARKKLAAKLEAEGFKRAGLLALMGSWPPAGKSRAIARNARKGTFLIREDEEGLPLPRRERRLNMERYILRAILLHWVDCDSMSTLIDEREVFSARLHRDAWRGLNALKQADISVEAVSSAMKSGKNAIKYLRWITRDVTNLSQSNATKYVPYYIGTLRNAI